MNESRRTHEYRFPHTAIIAGAGTCGLEIVEQVYIYICLFVYVYIYVQNVCVFINMLMGVCVYICECIF